MNELEAKIKAKIPGADTGIEIKHCMCDICAPGSHCGVDAYVRDGKIIKIEGTADHPASGGKLCTKGAGNRAYIYRSDRIMAPLRRTGERGSGEFEPISWDEAYGIIAEKLLAARAEHGANSVLFYSGYDKWYRFMLQRMAFAFGSMNYGAESSTCFNANRMAWMTMSGKHGRHDMANASLYVAWAGVNHHSKWKAGRALDNFHRRGGKVIIIDPRITPAVEHSCDLHLRIKPGTDGLLAACIAGIIIKNGWHDREYIDKYVHGFEEYAEYVCSIDPDYTARVTGLEKDKILQAAEMIGTIRPMSLEASPGSIIHQTNGYQSSRAIFALSAITGNYNRRGGNQPADFTYCEIGAGFKTTDEEFAIENMPEGYANRVGAERFPVWAGLITQMQCTDMARHILEAKPYPLKCLVAHGMNYRMFPDSGKMRRALESLDFFVDVDLFMTDTARLADIVLPACSSFEREEFKCYPGGWARYYKPAIAPLGQSRSDARIISELSARLGLEDKYLLAGYRACIEHVTRSSGLDMDKLFSTDEFCRSSKMKPWQELAYLDSGCATPTGKLELRSEYIAGLGRELDPLPKYYEPMLLPDSDYPMTLMAGVRLPNALHSRLHSVGWERALRPEPMADISPEDAAALEISIGDDIILESEQGSITVKANPTAAVAPGQVYMYHGYPEADVATLLNADALDPYSGFPGYLSGRCRIRKL